MDKKIASILCFASFLPYIGIIPWLVALIAYGDRKDLGKNLTTSIMIYLLGLIPGIGWIASAVFGIWGIVKICQGEMEPVLPVLEELNWCK